MTAANAFGRQVIDYLTNKSGGGVIAGDVVVIDTANNEAFTTTTTAGFTGGVGVAQETIANNAAGRVLRFGYAALVNVDASVTRGHFGKTFTVAKQATDAGATRGVGTFCEFLTGGTTPTASLFPVDLLGSSLTNPMTTTGDMIYSSDNSGTPARLAAVATGSVLKSAGTSTAPAWGYTPLTSYDLPATGNATIVTAGTFVDAAGVSQALGAGTYLIVYHVCFQPIVATAQFYEFTARLYDGTTVYDEVELDTGNNAVNDNGFAFTVTGSCVITLSGAQTIKVQGTSNRSSSAVQMSRNVPNNSATSNTATRMSIVRVA